MISLFQVNKYNTAKIYLTGLLCTYQALHRQSEGTLMVNNTDSKHA